MPPPPLPPPGSQQQPQKKNFGAAAGGGGWESRKYPVSENYIDLKEGQSWRIGALKYAQTRKDGGKTFDGDGLILTRYPKPNEVDKNGKPADPYETWLPVSTGIPTRDALVHLLRTPPQEEDGGEGGGGGAAGQEAEEAQLFCRRRAEEEGVLQGRGLRRREGEKLVEGWHGQVQLQGQLGGRDSHSVPGEEV